MRPESLDELVGQEDLVGPGRPLRLALEGGRLGSMIFYGPPGTGKTTLAHLIARHGRAHFEQVNAVTSGVADLRRVIEAAAERWRFHGQRTVVFIDEIHRFNKAQQDALLPSVEDGTIILVGATTENPFFQVNSALLSRCRLFRLEPLEPAHIDQVIERALQSEKGLAGRFTLEDRARERLLRAAGGDARRALNSLETAAWVAEAAGRTQIELADVEAALQAPPLRYDREGDQHYDVFSAFIKSMRGSDPDAALHYLARMLEAGEDPRAIARRIVIHASEDVGNADPQALVVAVAAAAGGGGGGPPRSGPQPGPSGPLHRHRPQEQRHLPGPGRRAAGCERAWRPTRAAPPAGRPLSRGQAVGSRRGIPLPP